MKARVHTTRCTTARKSRQCIAWLTRFPASFALMAAVVAIVLFTASPAALHAQSLSFAGAQTTVGFSLHTTPWGVTTDKGGDVFTSQGGLLGQEAVKVTPAGVQTIVPANVEYAMGIAVDGAGDIFVVDSEANQVVKVTPAGVQTTVPFSGLNAPYGVAVDGSGDVFVADSNNNRVLEITPAGAQTTVPATGISLPEAVAVDGAGNVFIADTNHLQVVEVPAGGGAQTTVPATGLSLPTGVAVDAADDVFIADPYNSRVVEVTPAGVQTTLPFSGLNAPAGVAVDPAGDVFVADSGNYRVVELSKSAVNFGSINVCPTGQTTPAPCNETLTLTYNVTSSGTVNPTVLTEGRSNLDFSPGSGTTCLRSLTAGSTCAIGVTFTPKSAGLRTGVVQITNNSGTVVASTPVYGFAQGPAVAFSPSPQRNVTGGLSGQTGVAVDGGGTLFVADGANDTVVQIGAAAIASGLGGDNTLALDAADDVFIADPNNNRVLKVAAGPGGHNAQSTVGTGLSFPASVAVDGAGDVFIADSNNNRVVEVPADGASQITVGSGFNYPSGVAVDGAGDVFIADSQNHRVVEIFGNGVQTTIGSGFSTPLSVAVDAAGDVFVLDFSSADLVEVSATGVQTTVATGLNGPYQVALDASGNIYVADSGNNRVLEIEQPTPSALSFAATNYEETSSDSPHSIVVQNIGNQPLNAVSPGLSVGANFEQVAGSGTPEDCTSSFSLAAGASCNLSISFTPTSIGSIQSSAVLTDNALNFSAAQQSISLRGTGESAAPTLSFAAVSTQTYGAAPFAVSATSNSTGAITYSVVSGPATISGNTVTITGWGTVTLQASVAATSDYAAATATTSFTVNEAVLTVTINNASRQYGAANPAFGYTITGFVNGDTSSVVAGSATMTTTATSTSAPGSYPISIATQNLWALNYTFNYVSGTLTVNQASQTIIFGALPTVTYGVAPITLGATASSGLPVSYTVTGPATISGNTLTITGWGTVTVTANEAGNANYTAATAVSQSFTVNEAVLTVTVNNATRQYGAANPAFSYTIAGFVNGDTSSVVAGSATMTTTATSTSAPGSYPISIATQNFWALNYTFNYVSGTLTVNQGSQTISFGALSNVTYGVAPITLGATTSSGLPVSYTVTGPATLSGSTLTITGAGTITVTANQAGNADYTAATAVTQSFTVDQVALTVTAANASRPYGAANPAFTYSITGFVTGDTSSVVSGTATETTTATSTSAPGSYPISFSAESLTAANYTFNYVNGTLTIGQTSQTITFGALSNVTYGAAPITLGATASSGLPVSYLVTGPATLSGSTITITGAGTVTVTASQAGNADYTAAASVTQSFTVNQASQTITFNPVSSQSQGASLTLSAAASSGLTVSFSSLTSSVCTVSGTTATLLSSGTCTIQASQAGNANYAAATPVSQSFTVSPGFTITPDPGSETITAGVLAGFILQINPVNGFNGNVTLSCSGGPAGAQCADLPQTVKVNGVAYAVSGILFPANTAPGTYTMTFTGTSGSISNSTTATFTVTQ